MYFENRLYGHSDILSAYAYAGEKRDPRYPVLGYIQHGWNPNTQYAVRRRLPWIPVFTWSTRAKIASRSRGVENVFALGAPFVYLTELLAPQPRQFDRRRVLLFPFHTTESMRQRAPHRELVQEVVAAFSPARIEVCLFYKEYLDVAIRREYEKAGVIVSTNGPRWDRTFLYRLVTRLISADLVVTNRVATVAWYAAYLRVPTRIVGPRFGIHASEDMAEVETVEYRRWPFFFSDVGDTSTEPEAFEAASRELGADVRRSALELREMLGWAHGRDRALARLLSVGYRIRTANVSWY